MSKQNETLSYSEGSKGWPSFYSYIPEFMKGMNSYFYSFDGGNLYRHNTNTLRNNYYGVQYESSITGVFNTKPLVIKLFKTMSFESNAAWEVKSLFTDLSTGSMLDTFFEQKEGEWFSYIRNKDTTLDFKLRSANGIANLLDSQDITAPTPPALGEYQLEFDATVNIGSIISYGDSVFEQAGSSNVLLGTVASVNKNKLIINYAGATPTPTNGNFIFFYKNPVAESNGARGYFMQFEITLPTTVTTPVELFSVGSSIMQSYP